MTTNTVSVGRLVLTRVGYVDVNIDPAIAGLTPAQIAGVPWAEPVWAQGDELRAGAAVWVIDDGSARIAVDPAQAADEILRGADAAVHQEAFANILTAAGMPRETFTHAICTHMEGIGMWAWKEADGSWSPFFPNAAIAVAQRELDAIDAGEHPSPVHPAFAELRARGVLRPISSGEHVSEHVSVEHVGAHTPGHLFVRVASEGAQAVMLGHLAVNALHLVTGPCPQQHPRPDEAQARIDRLLDEDAILIGPLWPAPGAGRWNGRELVPLTDGESRLS
jgi:glyoxylase-like metal-dependent hydrolase (beta-lactamase superfamily II)